MSQPLTRVEGQSRDQQGSGATSHYANACLPSAYQEGALCTARRAARFGSPLPPPLSPTHHRPKIYVTKAEDTVPSLPTSRTFRARVADALRRLSVRTSPAAPASKGKLLSVGASEWLRDEALRARAERHKVS